MNSNYNSSKFLYTPDVLKTLVHSSLTAMLCVSQHDTIGLLRNLHFRFENGKTSRCDCSFQVLNAYDLYYEFIPLFEVPEPSKHQANSSSAIL